MPRVVFVEEENVPQEMLQENSMPLGSHDASTFERISSYESTSSQRSGRSAMGALRDLTNTQSYSS